MKMKMRKKREIARSGSIVGRRLSSSINDVRAKQAKTCTAPPHCREKTASISRPSCGSKKRRPPRVTYSSDHALTAA